MLLLMIGLVVMLSGCGQPTDYVSTTADMKASGSWWTSNVVYYFSLALDTFADWFGGAYGLAILVMVLIVRTLILPLTLKQVKSSKAMQAIQPELNKIRETYKDNPEKQQQETMKLFQENKVNPMAGCFPLIIQMPVFIALYNSIYHNSAIREHSFLWLQLGEPDKLYILPLIAALTTYIQTKMMSSMTPQNNVQGINPMKFMMYVYPVLIFIMAYNFAAALPLYWIFSNLYTIVQNFFIYRKKDPVVALNNSAAAVPAGKSKKSGSNLKAGHPGKSGAKEAKKSK